MTDKKQITLDDIIKKYSKEATIKHLDEALKRCGHVCTKEYEEIMELWKTYGGD